MVLDNGASATRNTTKRALLRKSSSMAPGSTTALTCTPPQHRPLKIPHPLNFAASRSGIGGKCAGGSKDERAQERARLCCSSIPVRSAAQPAAFLLLRAGACLECHRAIAPCDGKRVGMTADLLQFMAPSCLLRYVSTASQGIAGRSARCILSLRASLARSKALCAGNSCVRGFACILPAALSRCLQRQKASIAPKPCYNQLSGIPALAQHLLGSCKAKCSASADEDC